MKNITEEQIVEKINKINPNIKFISTEIVRKNKRSRRLVKMICECGEEFIMIYEKIECNKYLLCNKCSKEKQVKTRKNKYNEKYKKIIKKYGYKLINENQTLYANKLVEVEQVDTGYRGYIYPNQPAKNMIIFGFFNNHNNFIYNINKYAENNGIKSRAIKICEDDNKKLEFICECGNKFIANYRSFERGKFYCENCYNNYSNNEIIFANFLKENNIEFIQEFSINSLKDEYPLRFDFYISKYKCFIEIDGQHHFTTVNFGGKLTEEEMNKRLELYQKHDKMKEDYCNNYNIPLLRIKYTDIQNNNYINIFNNFIQSIQE